MALPDDAGRADRYGVPPTIRELVQSHQDATGMSVRQLEAKSAEGGERVSFSYFHKIIKGNVRDFPTNPETISGIARALGTSELAVVLGFARQRGIEVRMPAFASQLPVEVDRIPAAEQRALLTYLRIRATGETDAPVQPMPDVDDEVTPEEIERGLIPGRPATPPRRTAEGCRQS